MSWIVSGLWSVRIPHLLFDLLISLFPLKKQGGGEVGMGLWGCGVVEGVEGGWWGGGVEELCECKKRVGCVCINN